MQLRQKSLELYRNQFLVVEKALNSVSASVTNTTGDVEDILAATRQQQEHLTTLRHNLEQLQAFKL